MRSSNAGGKRKGWAVQKQPGLLYGFALPFPDLTRIGQAICLLHPIQQLIVHILGTAHQHMMGPAMGIRLRYADDAGMVDPPIRGEGDHDIMLRSAPDLEGGDPYGSEAPTA